MANLSLKQLFDAAVAGDKNAESELADYFFDHAIRLAKLNLPTAPDAIADHEDLAVSAMKSLCGGIRRGHFEFRGDAQLHSLLKLIVSRKTKRLLRKHYQGKEILTEADLGSDGIPFQNIGLTPEFIGILEDSSVKLAKDEMPVVERILSVLPSELHGFLKQLLNELDDQPRKALLLLMEHNLSNKELGKRLGRSKATVERYRMLIREKIKEISGGEDTSIGSD